VKKKIFLSLLAPLLLPSVYLAAAQQPKTVPRIGYVSGFGDLNDPGPQVVAFRQGLRDLGYIEGKTSWLSIATLREKGTKFQSL
jgi:putative ABC transport system substrate-binding protein